MDDPSYRSFLVRLWREPGIVGERWCGEIEFIQSGAVVSVTSLEEAFHLIRHAADTDVQGDAETEKPQPRSA